MKTSCISPSSRKGIFCAIDSFVDRIDLDYLEQYLSSLNITLENLRRHVKFSENRYQRNLVQSGPAYQALVLCWRNGQRSPIHDHEGSSCAVKVLAGVMTETIFERAPNGMIKATRSLDYKCNIVAGSQDADIHQVSNLQADGLDLITLHIYSPPLLFMNEYSLVDTSVKSCPALAMEAGAGI